MHRNATYVTRGHSAISISSQQPLRMQPRINPAHPPYRGFSCRTPFHKVCPTDFRWKTPDTADAVRLCVNNGSPRPRVDANEYRVFICNNSVFVLCTNACELSFPCEKYRTWTNQMNLFFIFILYHYVTFLFSHYLRYCMICYVKVHIKERLIKNILR